LTELYPELATHRKKEKPTGTSGTHPSCTKTRTTATQASSISPSEPICSLHVEPVQKKEHTCKVKQDNPTRKPDIERPRFRLSVIKTTHPFVYPSYVLPLYQPTTQPKDDKFSIPGGDSIDPKEQITVLGVQEVVWTQRYKE
jgi:hypothetical protein